MEFKDVLHIMLSIVGSTFAAYVGVRVAIAQHAARIAALEEADKRIEERINRLEHPYFQRGSIT